MNKFLLKLKEAPQKVKKTDFFRTFKEELVAVPLLVLFFYLFNFLMITIFPNGAFFDFYSEIETIVSKIVIYLVALWTAHLSLRIAFPKIYKFLHDEVYHNFENLDHDKKIGYTINFILVFILAAALIFGAIA